MPVRTGQKNEIPPQLKPEDTLQFIASHRPGLPAGEYRIEISQTIEGAGIPSETFSSGITDFIVAGPRFRLPTEDVQGVFPPRAASGSFNHVLPHIILKRSTLPWERSAYDGEDVDPKNRPSWLALLVFDRNDLEADDIQNLEIHNAREIPEDGKVLFPGLPEMSADPADSTLCTTINVRWKTLKHLMPGGEELAYLTHVRATTTEHDGIETSTDHAVVIANRLPKEETHVSVHLVSLEGLFERVNDDTENPAFDFIYRQRNPAPKDNDKIRLISLYSWNYFCQKEKGDTFEDLFDGINEGQATYPPPFRLPSEDIDDEGARHSLASGFIPLRHRFRGGERSASWYHGPFVPTGSPMKKEVVKTLWPSLLREKGANAPAGISPIRSSDELVLYNANQGLFDVSYAAAWNLGRLLVLENTRIANKLYNWKRKHTQHEICKLVHDECEHLPIHTDPGDSPALDTEVKAWFERHLILLEGLPFNYIVPDERLLPPESIRFFNVDPFWLHFLCDGAFSIDRIINKDVERDLLLNAHLPSGQPMSGFLMRSKLVSGFSDMAIDAYAEDPLSAKPATLVAERMKVRRKDFLSPNVLLMLFEGNVQAVDFYLCPETIHFGVQVSKRGSSEVFTKLLSKIDNQMPAKDEIDVPFRKTPRDLRVVDVPALRKKIEAQFPDNSNLPPEDFARQMIDGAPLIRLVRSAHTNNPAA